LAKWIDVFPLSIVRLDGDLRTMLKAAPMASRPT
jgi:hypothetical protein